MLQHVYPDISRGYASAGRVIGLSLALFFKTNYSHIRVLHVHVLLSLLIQNQSDQKKYVVLFHWILTYNRYII